jgi:hypothetical protein
VAVGLGLSEASALGVEVCEIELTQGEGEWVADFIVQAAKAPGSMAWKTREKVF